VARSSREYEEKPRKQQRFVRHESSETRIQGWGVGNGGKAGGGGRFVKKAEKNNFEEPTMVKAVKDNNILVEVGKKKKIKYVHVDRVKRFYERKISKKLKHQTIQTKFFFLFLFFISFHLIRFLIFCFFCSRAKEKDLKDIKDKFCFFLLFILFCCCNSY
jgi:hypothetical protein